MYSSYGSSPPGFVTPHNDNFIAIDQMKRFGGRLVFLIFTDKNFAGNKQNARVETWFKGKDH